MADLKKKSDDEGKNKPKIKIHCTMCGKKLKENEALVHKNSEGEKVIICYDCFEKEVGVDYETFKHRKNVAFQVILATIFCIGASIYAFIEKGPLYGVAGLIVAILIFMYAGKTD